MKLRSDRPYWPTTVRRSPFASTIPRKNHFDVLVIGAGITGALVAYEVTKAGGRVAVVDKHRVGSGSTPASTALLQYEIDTPLVKLSRILGKAHAGAAYVMSRRALHAMESISDELGGGVDLEARKSLYLAVKATDVPKFRKEATARLGLGIPLTMLSRAALRSRFGLDRPGAILSDEAFEINPLKLTYRLLNAARKRGVVVRAGSEADLGSLADAARPFRVGLAGGGTIRADRIVIATGYETPEHFQVVASLTELRSTYALITTALREEPWPERALLWDAGDPYFYARTTPDGRVIVGGEDEPFTTPAERDALIETKSRALMTTLRELLPGRRFRTAFRWAGTFAQTKDGLPYIGEHERCPGVLFALGYGGNGITFSVIAAKVIAGIVSGTPHPAAKLFRFDR